MASQDPPVVLLVEDEPLVRMTAADGLEEAGFQVLEAANADVALTNRHSVAKTTRPEGTHLVTSGSIYGQGQAEPPASQHPPTHRRL
jgi:CheY-like chemotaxis protein